MHDDFIRVLTHRRALICDRWEALLRVEPVVSPLGHPDTLVFGIRGAMREIFALMRSPPAGGEEPPATCACGRNPLDAFYRAGEQALLEALVLAQAEHRDLTPAQRDASFAELRWAIRHMKHREISALASLCQLEPKPDAPAKPA